MISSEVQRTLVKSPPELWAELSDPASLARHLGELGEIRITRTEPERTVEWEAADTTGKVLLKQSGWGTKVTLTAAREVAVPEPIAEPEPEPAIEVEPEPEPVAVGEPEPAAVAVEPEAIVAELSPGRSRAVDFSHASSAAAKSRRHHSPTSRRRRSNQSRRRRSRRPSWSPPQKICLRHRRSSRRIFPTSPRN